MTEKLCSVCNDVGDILGATCQVCAGGTWSGYDGCYMSFGGGSSPLRWPTCASTNILI